MSRPHIAAAAASAIPGSSCETQARAPAAKTRSAAQAAGPDEAQEKRRAIASAQAAHALLPAATALRPILAALHVLLDMDSMRVSSYMPGGHLMSSHKARKCCTQERLRMTRHTDW